MAIAQSTTGFSNTPALIIALAPSSSSSPGWNISLMVPFSSLSHSLSIFAAPSSIVVCISCPQEWQAPVSQAKGTPLTSV